MYILFVVLHLLLSLLIFWLLCFIFCFEFWCLFLRQNKLVNKKSINTTSSSGNIFVVSYLSTQTVVQVCLQTTGSLRPRTPRAHLPPCRASSNCSSEWMELRGACWVCQRRKQRSSCATFCSCCRQEIPT